MLRKTFAVLLLVLALASAARAADKVTVLLDWFVNPDHGPLFVAQYIGAYQKEGLDVSFIAPADPSLPASQVAAGQGDIAIGYQPNLYLLNARHLPLVRIGTLIDMPLSTLTALAGDGIQRMQDFKGKKIGYSVSGVEDVVVGTMLQHAGVRPADVQMINVNFALVPALLSHEVDGVVGAFRNFEVNEIREKGRKPVVFLPEDYGVPMNDALIFLANKNHLGDSRLPRFLAAVERGAQYMIAHPDEMWARFAQDHPELNNTLNKTAWYQTLPYFAENPFLLDPKRYVDYARFMQANKLIAVVPPLGDYAVQLAQP